MSATADEVRRRAEEATARFQARVAQVQSEIEDFQASEERYAALPEHQPATDADEAAEQLRRIRANLDHDLDVLEARIPPTDTLIAGARTYGGVVVAAGGTLGAAALLWSRRRARAAEQRRADAEADVLVRALLRRLADGADDDGEPSPTVVSVGVSGSPAADVAAAAGAAAAETLLDVDDGGSLRWWLLLVGTAAGVAAIWLRNRGGPLGADLWGPPSEL